MPYWIQDTLAATPALAWMFLGVGLPWALVMLPRRDWHDKPMVALLALAFGPALVTAWMYLLGSLPTPSLKIEWILAGTAVIAAAGWALAWRKPHPPTPSPPAERGGNPLAPDEKLLIALIAAALVIRWLGVAYWPFTAYDALWVYGYEGRLYTALGHIPNTIGYYPQFLPLQYTYLQIATGGVINDHAARAVIPFLHLGSILAAYTLGNRLFNRRVGIYVAAIWALYPHVAEWSRFGDLEIPTAFLFTAAAAFFLMAWGKSSVISHQSSVVNSNNSPLIPHPSSLAIRYAIIAGLLLGIGMWTKPTMGAFIWGVALLAAVEAARWMRDRGKGTRQIVSLRLRVVLWTAIASVPLGAVWYARNVLLGHEIITMPTGYWLTLAARSGAEFGWPLLAVLALVAYLLADRIVGAQRAAPLHPNTVEEGKPDRPPLQMTLVLLGIGLVLAGVLPSIFEPRRMAVLDWLALAVGSVVLARSLYRTVRQRWPDEAAKIMWALLLALPYFVTWFYSYSYHYRLSFPIVPLLILPTAVIVACWTQQIFTPPPNPLPVNGEGENTRIRPWLVRLNYLALIVALAVPGVINALYDPNTGWDWLWSGEMPDDFSRYASGNAALMAVVNGLQIFEREHGRPPVVVAPGIVRLLFFFPTADIRADAPNRLSELDGVDYFIYGLPETRGAYQDIPQQRNQVVSALALADYEAADTIMRKAWWKDDGNFDYTVYELHLQNRFVRPNKGVPPKEGDVVFGGFARYLGQSIGGDQFWPGRKLMLSLYWEVLAPPPDDYMIYIHLRDSDGNVWESWDGPVTRSNDGNYYSTLVWEPGEFIVDTREIDHTKPDIPTGNQYKIVVGFYSLLTRQRVPVTINGLAAGDSYTIKDSISVLPEAPG